MKKLDELIKVIEKDRKSKVLIYFTGHKQPIDQFGTLIASDVLPYFNGILKVIKKTNKISLIINTNGGHLDTPWPLINLIREHCAYLEVIVLERSLSAGTLLALGADKIIMSSYSQLGPIDPAANIVDSEKKQMKRVEIEDIIGYIDFVKDKMGIAEQNSLTEAMKELTKEISPTMLGSINRTHALIRKLAKNLLNLHKNKLPEKQLLEIMEQLTQKLYSHKHLINRKEAKNIVGFGNIIEFSSEKLENILDDLYNYYVDFFKINEEFDPIKILGDDAEKKYLLPRAAIDSLSIKYNFESEYIISKFSDPAGHQQIKLENPINKNNWGLKK